MSRARQPRTDPRDSTSTRPRGDRKHDADRHIHEQDPTPTQFGGEQAADHRAEGATASGDRRPRAECAPASLSLYIGRGDQREGDRCQHSPSEALQGTGEDELPARLREAASKTGSREEQQRRDEHTLATEEICEAPAEEQETREGQRVCVDDPLQLNR